MPVKKRRKSTVLSRNSGTMTEYEYMLKIREALRRAFRYWKPMMEALNLARRPAVNKGRLKWEYQCAHCHGWFSRKEVQIDHIIPCGSLIKLEDLPLFITRLTPETADAFQVLCKPHHKKKTKEDGQSTDVSL